ncbi:MAG TPA: hypothetical protein VIJ72_06555 [Rhizomicrobium sp.]
MHNARDFAGGKTAAREFMMRILRHGLSSFRPPNLNDPNERIGISSGKTNCFSIRLRGFTLILPHRAIVAPGRMKARGRSCLSHISY